MSPSRTFVLLMPMGACLLAALAVGPGAASAARLQAKGFTLTRASQRQPGGDNLQGVSSGGKLTVASRRLATAARGYDVPGGALELKIAGKAGNPGVGSSQVVPAYPLSAVGVLTDAAGNVVCTGTLVSEDTVLTSAQCLLMGNSEEWNQNVAWFCPGYSVGGSGAVKPWGCSEVSRRFKARCYNGAADHCDYGAVKLTKALGAADQAGHLRLSDSCFSKGDEVKAAAYLGDKSSGWKEEGCVVKRADESCEDGTLYYDCASAPSQRGTPMWKVQENKENGQREYNIIGVFTGSGNGLNVGAGINSPALGAIMGWVRAPGRG